MVRCKLCCEARELLVFPDQAGTGWSIARFAIGRQDEKRCPIGASRLLFGVAIRKGRGEQPRHGTGFGSCTRSRRPVFQGLVAWLPFPHRPLAFSSRI